MHPPVDHTKQLIARLAIVPSTIMSDNPVRVEKRPQDIREIKSTVSETGIALGIVSLEFHCTNIGHWLTYVKRYTTQRIPGNVA